MCFVAIESHINIINMEIFALKSFGSGACVELDQRTTETSRGAYLDFSLGFACVFSIASFWLDFDLHTEMAIGRRFLANVLSPHFN